MMRTLRIALAQINPAVGDLEGNVSKILSYIKKAKKSGARIIVFPELAITGYPPEDLVLKNQFIEDNLAALKKIQRNVSDILVIVGFVDKKEDIYNAAAVLHNKKLVDIYHKMYLPNYGVFDEYRYFRAGTIYPVYKINGTYIGINICEDIWYPEGPTRIQALAGAQVILNINASPYRIGKWKFREDMVSARALDNVAIVAYVNTVGGQDELVFDGHSMIIDQNGDVIVRGKQFEEDLIIADLNLEAVMMKRLRAPRGRQEVTQIEKNTIKKINIPLKKGSVKMIKPLPLRDNKILEPAEEIYRALVLGTYDYVTKNSFEAVAVGLSGGVDSSLVASVAVDALGNHKVKGIFMPSPYTSVESREDVYAIARNLGIKVIEIPIYDIFQSYITAFKKEFRGLSANVTEENLQARIRGNILMAFSNKFGWLVLTTGNKSEMSVGYATLYGDMAGGFAVIKDVPKTLVYEICKWKNNKMGKSVIPERVMTKEPTAELRPNQKDTDTLPPYSLLDPILKAYIEDDKSFEDILSRGYEAEVVRRVIKMINRSEYKRRQSPPGIKITQRAFGRDRRFPITNKYRDY